MDEINEWMAWRVPAEIYEVCSLWDLSDHLLHFQCDEAVVVASVETLPTIEKVGQKEKEKAPNFSDAVAAFNRRLKNLIDKHDAKPTSAIVSIQSKWRFQLNELLEFQNSLKKRLSFTPLILMGVLDEKKIDISCIIGCGAKRKSQGYRFAFDLDDTLTRWPSFFSTLSKQNNYPDSYNLIISTRYEPVSSSCHKAVYERELTEIESLDVRYDKLVHAWWPFDLAEKLFPCGNELDWMKRFIWHKVFYCRLYHIDTFYEDQLRNIELFRKYAPEIEVVRVQHKKEPCP